MTEITYWHRYAELFLRRELDLAEIVKIWYINTVTGVIPSDVPPMGIGIDNSELNDALVIGLILNTPDDVALTYSDMAEILGFHANTAANVVKRLASNGKITRHEQGRSGSTYKVNGKPKIPAWITEFTRALIELRTRPELKAQVQQECANITFRRGFEVIRDELSEKFNPRKKDKSDTATQLKPKPAN